MKHRRLSHWPLAPLLSLTLLCLRVPGAGQEIPLALGDPRHGRDACVEKGCIACHAVRGSGGKVGPDLAAALVGKGVTGIAAAMLNHYPKMNAAMQERRGTVPLLRPAEMDDLMAYLLFINFAREPGSAERGRAVFRQKGCINCHWFTPGGRAVAPPLGRASLSLPPILIAQAMWNHSTQMNTMMQEMQVVRLKFEAHEMADLLAFLSGAAEPLPRRGTPLPGDPLVGRSLFQSKGCARCHVRDQAVSSVGPDLTARSWYKTATEIAGEMWNHEPAMWARMHEHGLPPPRFEADQMADIIAYLYLLHSATGSGDPARGAELFTGKRCAQCHRAGGPGPALATLKQLDTPIHFAAEMWNNAPHMQAFVTDAGIAWPAFEAADVKDLVSYLSQQRAQATSEETSSK